MPHMPAPAPVSADVTALRHVDAALDRLIALIAEQTAREAAAGTADCTEANDADAPQDT